MINIIYRELTIGFCAMIPVVIGLIIFFIFIKASPKILKMPDILIDACFMLSMTLTAIIIIAVATFLDNLFPILD